MQLTFMASYSIVLAPIAALMAFDFFVIKHARIDIYQLYRPTGIYRFTGGWNWRAFTALLIAVIPNLPGMINAIDATVRRDSHSRYWPVKTIDLSRRSRHLT